MAKTPEASPTTRATGMAVVGYWTLWKGGDKNSLVLMDQGTRKIIRARCCITLPITILITSKKSNHSSKSTLKALGPNPFHTAWAISAATLKILVRSPTLSNNNVNAWLSIATRSTKFWLHLFQISENLMGTRTISSNLPRMLEENPTGSITIMTHINYRTPLIIIITIMTHPSHFSPKPNSSTTCPTRKKSFAPPTFQNSITVKPTPTYPPPLARTQYNTSSNEPSSCKDVGIKTYQHPSLQFSK